MNKLNVGDVIWMEEGESCDGKIRHDLAFINGEKEYTSYTNIGIGIEYNNSGNRKYTVDQETSILHRNTEIPLNICRDFLEKNLAKKPIQSMTFPIGEYLVLKASMAGGSTGRDAYPDGWYVECIKINKDNTLDHRYNISFYQSGCFCNLKPNKKAIREVTIEKPVVPLVIKDKE